MCMWQILADHCTIWVDKRLATRKAYLVWLSYLHNCTLANAASFHSVCQDWLSSDPLVWVTAHDCETGLISIPVLTKRCFIFQLCKNGSALPCPANTYGKCNATVSRSLFHSVVQHIPVSCTHSVRSVIIYPQFVASHCGKSSSPSDGSYYKWSRQVERQPWNRTAEQKATRQSRTELERTGQNRIGKYSTGQN